MISPSDADMPEGRRSGAVHALEFEAVDHPLRRRSDWAVGHDAEQDGVAKRLREEMAALDLRFRAQTQHINGSIAEERRLAKLEAREEWADELATLVAREREQIVTALAAFTRQRAEYFTGVEGEVVRLSLAIAARVLHREAMLDPLLLGAVVRVALEKVEEESGTVLHVPVAQVEAWRALLAAEHGAMVQVVGEERMDATECVLETSVGRVELGVVEQLGEIERGFFDLLQQRPV